jgi:hypothetical protein
MTTTTTNAATPATTDAKAKKAIMTAEQKKALAALPTTSARIRWLDSKSVSRGDIARIMTEFNGKECRYQHVRNVLVTPVKNPKA